MHNADYFSPDYATARSRFRQTAANRGAELAEFIVPGEGPGDEELAIDLAVFGTTTSPRTVVVSSGVHGVEGFFGSAVQLAWLEQCAAAFDHARGRIVLIHAVNPYGFAWRRRWSENSVDLNRNWLLPGETYSGSPPLYKSLDSWLNRQSPPSRWQPFLPCAVWMVFRHGMQAVRESLPAGQYDFPQGLFFGGHQPTPSHEIVSRNFDRWIGDAQEVLHLDFHTGLGPSAGYKLLLDDAADAPTAEWFFAQFGREHVSPAPPAGASGPQSAGYPTRGSWDKWCAARYSDRAYRFACVEFGTHPPMKVIAALRAENRAHHWGRGGGDYEWTKQRLVEAFAPASPAWREAVVRDGVALVSRGIDASFP